MRRRGTFGVVLIAVAGFSVVTSLFPVRLANASGPVQIGSPADGQTVSGTVSIAAEAGSGVEWVNFYVDGNYRSSSPPYTYSWDSTVVATGRHTLTVTAYDANDNQLGSSQVAVIVNEAGPGAGASGDTGSLQVTSPGNNTTVSGTVTVGASIPGGTQWVNFYVDGSYLASSPPFSVAWNSSRVSDGTHSITVRAYGSGNNSLGSDSVSVTVSNGSSGSSGGSGGGSSSGGSNGNFVTLSPGSSLPSGSTCAGLVNRNGFEPRPANYDANHTTPSSDDIASMRASTNNGGAPQSYFQRVDGNFTGTTDEILQWGACKWGFDVNLVRALAAQESWWRQSGVGDNGITYGIMQIKKPDYPASYPMSKDSTAFNVDYKLAYQRACFEGTINYIQGRNGYPESDSGRMLWGCVGQWYSGSWYDSGASDYISQMQSLLDNRPWQQPGF